MGQECQMVGRDFGLLIVWSIFVARTAHSKEMKLSVLSAASLISVMKRG
jgi:hypothetical protein